MSAPTPSTRATADDDEAVASRTPPAALVALQDAERLRGLSPAALQQELATLSEADPDPRRQMRLALALLQTQQPAEAARALSLLQRLGQAPEDPDTLALRSLARLLAVRLQEQRRLEDGLERQAQQLKDAQRRIELLSDRLEAMRAIERSLNKRPPAARPLP